MKLGRLRGIKIGGNSIARWTKTLLFFLFHDGKAIEGEKNQNEKSDEIYDSPKGHPISILEIHNPEAAHINAYLFSSSAAYISPVSFKDHRDKYTGITTIIRTPERERERNITRK